MQRIRELADIALRQTRRNERGGNVRRKAMKPSDMDVNDASFGVPLAAQRQPIGFLDRVHDETAEHPSGSVQKAVEK